MSSKILAGFIVALILVGGGSFYGGIKYQEAKTPTTPVGRMMGPNGFGGANGQGRRGGPNGTGIVAGDVINKDASSLTINTPNTGSKVVLIASSTRVSKMQDGTLADVNAGTEVVVNGTANSDGSVTAQTIQIRPAGSPLFGQATSTR